MSKYKRLVQDFEDDRPGHSTLPSATIEETRHPNGGIPLTPQTILHLQRTIGNQAVVNQLANRQNPAVQRAPADLDTKAPPVWSRTSTGSPLPGEHVHGITDRFGPGKIRFSEADRQALKDALYRRHQENAKQGPDFSVTFATALTEVWTNFVTDDMVKTADDAGWSILTKVILFALKDVFITLMFPEIMYAKAAFMALMATKAIEKATALGLDLYQDVVQDMNTGGELEKRGKELGKMTSVLTPQIELVLRSTMEEVGDSFYYADWLENAPLDDLHLFRVPYAIPKISRGQVATHIAQYLTSILHDQKGTSVDRGYDDYGNITPYIENGVLLNLQLDGAGRPISPNPILHTSKALSNELYGHTIGEMPQVPLYIELDCLPLFAFPPDEMDALRQFETLWPHKSHVVIRRTSDGRVSVDPGVLPDMFRLYAMLHPGISAGQLARSYTKRLGSLLDMTSPMTEVNSSPMEADSSPMEQTPLGPPRPHTMETVFPEFYSVLDAAQEEGAEILIQKIVNPLTIKRPARWGR